MLDTAPGRPSARAWLARPSRTCKAEHGWVHAIAALARIPDGAGRTAQSDRKRRGRYDVTLLQARFVAWGVSPPVTMSPVTSA